MSSSSAPGCGLKARSEQKRLAYETIYYVMRRLIGLLAPFCPHITEEIYQNLHVPERSGKHPYAGLVCRRAALINAELEHAVELVRSFDDAVPECPAGRQTETPLAGV